MGQRGPKPKANAVTRHKPKQRQRTLLGAPVEIPALVGEHRAETYKWWDTWVDSPQATFLSATDWQTLVRLVPIVDLYFEKPTSQLAAEIRQTEAKLGATAQDRDRLGWKIEPETAADEKPAASGSRGRPDPRTAK